MGGSGFSGAFGNAERTGDRFVDSRAFELLARGGFVARSVVYAIMGILAFKLALGNGGTTVNQQGALRTVAEQPFGHLLLTLLAIGLGGYALWRLFRAALGHGPEGSDTGPERLAALASGAVYAGLCAIAVEMLIGSGGGQGTSSSSSAGVLGSPLGRWLVGLAGAVAIGIGLVQGYRALGKGFLKESKTERMGRTTRMWFGRIGMVGHLGRMLVFALVGVFLVKAALDYNPSDAVGLDGALAKLLRHSYGAVAVGVVAGGMIAFALYSLVDARYHRI